MNKKINTLEKFDAYKFDLFEVEFLCDSLVSVSAQFLSNQIIEVTPRQLGFRLNIIDNKIVPIDVLVDLFSNNIIVDIIIKPLSKEGTVLAEIKYKNVKITRIDFFEMAFNYNNQDILNNIDLSDSSLNNDTTMYVDIETQQIFFNNILIVQ